MKMQRTIISALFLLLLCTGNLLASDRTVDRVSERIESYREDRLPLVLDPKEDRHIRFTRKVQAALQNAGYYNGAIDGVSGPQTQKAIKAFQITNDLVVDGLVGPQTWGKLKGHFYSNSAVE